MIIGISGRISSGKDTTGEIIQYLYDKNSAGFTNKDGFTDFSDYIKYKHNRVCNWQIKKFADKLKECVSIITGIPRADLEKAEVKNRELGEEWIRYEQYDRNDKEWRRTSKEFYNKYCNNINHSNEFRKTTYTVRQLLQEFGTDACRNIIHPNFWVNALFSEYRPLDDTLRRSMLTAIDYSDCPYPNWIITDMRFPNELKAVKDKRGISIRCNRTPKSKWTDAKDWGHPEHTSETALDDATFDYVLDNNGTIEELIVQVKEILIKEKIL